MRFSRFLVTSSIVCLAAALTPWDWKECGYSRNVGFNGTGPDTLVRCAETTYVCNETLHGSEWFIINSTVESVPADCKKDIYGLSTYHNMKGPITLPGLTELDHIRVTGDYNGSRVDKGPSYVLIPTGVTNIDLPDLVNITGHFIIDNADSIPSLNVPKLRHIGNSLRLNFTGGPAINLTFPSLFDVGDVIFIDGEIDTIDFPNLNTTDSPIVVNSSGNIDCDAFAAKVVNSTNYKGVSCTSKKGTVTLNPERPPEPVATSAASRIQRRFLASTAILAYILVL